MRSMARPARSHFGSGALASGTICHVCSDAIFALTAHVDSRILE